MSDDGAVTTLTLTGFLLARIAEDENGQRVDFGGECGVPEDRHWSRARVLAECEAKRQIVEEHAWTDGGEFYQGSSVGSQRIADDDEPFDLACVCCGEWSEYAVPWPCRTLRALAAVYADHPDYREEWKP